VFDGTTHIPVVIDDTQRNGSKRFYNYFCALILLRIRGTSLEILENSMFTTSFISILLSVLIPAGYLTSEQHLLSQIQIQSLAIRFDFLTV
jgi:hypothetical protein